MRFSPTRASRCRRRWAPLVALLAATAGLAAAAPPADAATLRLSVAPAQTPDIAGAVRVTVSGTADERPVSCPAGIGCELTIFVIRSGICPAQPAALLDDENIVVFLTPTGLPALLGTTPEPFTATADYFLDGAPTAGRQGNAAEGDTESILGTFIFCGYLGDATASATFENRPVDQLDTAGPGRLRVTAAGITVYRATCASPPCSVRLTERAFAGPRPLAALGRRELPQITENGSGDDTYVVSFSPALLDAARLRRALARHGSIELRFRATLTDAAGARITARRTIVIHR
jgi:hypothetical protein